MTDSTPESPEPEQTKPQKKKRHVSWQRISGLSPIDTPVHLRFDPPLEHRSYEEIYEEVKVAMAAIEKRRFGRKKAK